MSYLKIIQDAIARQNYQGISHHVIARGIALPLDLFGSGLIRYGVKREAVLPLFTPDNRYRLAEDAVFEMDRITLNRLPIWITAGSYITINGRELHVVDDVVDRVLLLGSKLRADQPANQPVIHYSNPVKVEGNYSAGKDVINIDIDAALDLFLVRGDHIAISSRRDVTLAFKEYRIVDYNFTSEVNGIKQYQITLDRGIHRDLEDEEIIQIRAFMAYQSKILPIPITSSNVYYISGPFLVDWKSVPFIQRTTISETQTIQRYDATRSPIGPPIEINKNTLMLEQPIKAQQFLFWDKVEGEINYDKDLDRFLSLLTEEGKWWLKHKCVPLIQIPSTFASGYIVTSEPGTLTNNEYFVIDDGELDFRFEYKVNSSYVPTPVTPATGYIHVNTIIGMVNNDWFSLDDGFGTKVFFEYMVDAPTFTATTGYRVIDVTSAVVATDVVVQTESAINAVPELKIDAVRDSFLTRVNLTNQVTSVRGNQPIEFSTNLTAVCTWTASPGVAPFSMVGGTYDLETMDISAATTALEVATATSAAINRAKLKVTTDFAGVFNSFRLRTSVPGIAGNIPIVRGISTSDYLISGMSGGTGGVRWNVLMYPVGQDVIMRVRFFPNDWLPTFTLPADTNTTVVLELSSTDLPVERIDILMKGESAGEVRMSDWNISTPLVANISHEYVTQMVGDHTYAANGLWVKPLFPTLREVETKLGVTGVLNTGRLHV